MACRLECRSYCCYAQQDTNYPRAEVTSGTRIVEFEFIVVASFCFSGVCGGPEGVVDALSDESELL